LSSQTQTNRLGQSAEYPFYFGGDVVGTVTLMDIVYNAARSDNKLYRMINTAGTNNAGAVIAMGIAKPNSILLTNVGSADQPVSRDIGLHTQASGGVLEFMRASGKITFVLNTGFIVSGNDDNWRVEGNIELGSGGDVNLYRDAANRLKTDDDLETGAGTTVILGAPENGQIVGWLDESGNNLTFKVKYSGGTVKSGTVALA
jgi:hypothetical protein